MADQDHYKTHVRETRTTESSNTGLALIIGGLVVAVAFVVWLVVAGPSPVAPAEGVEPATPVEPIAPVENVDPVAPTDGSVAPAPADE
jgi:hypothetical protein